MARDARLAVVIDDIGESRAAGLEAIALPGPLTVAVLPFTPYADELARRAFAAGVQVIVHLPMQSSHGHVLGRGSLTSRLDRAEFEHRAKAALDAVPFATGVSNHMGSALTPMRRAMDWLMGLLSKRRGWMFLDSRTTALTVAAHAAASAGIAVASRDVFLDNRLDAEAIADALARAAEIARERGMAVAIGHPHPETLRVLARELPRLEATGIELVSVASIAERRAASALRAGYSSAGQALATK